MSEQPVPLAGGEVPAPVDRVGLVVHDDLARSRVTVFFRAFLAIPHLFILVMWGTVAGLLAVVDWFSILFTGRPRDELHKLQSRYVRYLTQVTAYLSLAAQPWPSIAAERPYPIDVETPAPGPQSRWKTALRLVLALPSLLLAAVLTTLLVQAFIPGVLVTAALLAWFACLALGRMPQGLRDLCAYALDYSAQVVAYLLLVTDRYPDSDPYAVRYPNAAPAHPVRIVDADDLRRSRLTVFFRFLLWLPHFVWLTLWSVVAMLAAVANWVVTLLAGRSPDALHRFLAAYARYAFHTAAFVLLVANPFPGFTGAPGRYPVDLDIAPPERQSRWKTGFRLILFFPAGMVLSALINALYLVALFGWFVALVRGEMPRGLRNLGAFVLRYQAQGNAYVLLLTDRYPFSGPSQEAAPAAPPAADPAPAPAPAPA